MFTIGVLGSLMMTLNSWGHLGFGGSETSIRKAKSSNTLYRISQNLRGGILRHAANVFIVAGRGGPFGDLLAFHGFA